MTEHEKRISFGCYLIKCKLNDAIFKATCQDIYCPMLQMGVLSLCPAFGRAVADNLPYGVLLEKTVCVFQQKS